MGFRVGKWRKKEESSLVEMVVAARRNYPSATLREIALSIYGGFECPFILINAIKFILKGNHDLTDEEIRASLRRRVDSTKTKRLEDAVLRLPVSSHPRFPRRERTRAA